MRKEYKRKCGKVERWKRRIVETNERGIEEKYESGNVEKKKSPGYYNQYPGDHLFYLLIYLLKCGGLQIHRNKRGANVYKY